jgi:LmbE family N-acetylglucosaminyl deacetylase
MKTIYLSPHLDDAVFSCGAWIWEQTQQGKDVEIWTICAGDPPAGPLSDLSKSLHESWQLAENAVQIRREEDCQACQIIGAVAKHLPFLDCIYRSSRDGDYFYQTAEDIFGGLDSRERDLINEVSTLLADLLPPQVEIIVPLGIGNHVDHELTRKAASRLGRKMYYYADYPYAREMEGKEILEIMARSREWQALNGEISENGLDHWWQSARAYQSQIDTFWENEEDLGQGIRDFSTYLGGMTLWEAVEEED